MKIISQSMDPREAAKAFYGLDDAAFSKIIEHLTRNDPRLMDVFKRTRQRFLENGES